MDKRYTEILDIEYPIENHREKMSSMDRATQFAPFAALTGYDSYISEAGRETDKVPVRSEEDERKLNAQLQYLKENYQGHPFISVTLFKKDLRKEGGHYKNAEGFVKRLDENEKIIYFTNKEKISLDEVMNMEIRGNNHETGSMLTN